jgi:MarR family transcriptional regulator, temperature-dependent positive regulator of motility
LVTTPVSCDTVLPITNHELLVTFKKMNEYKVLKEIESNPSHTQRSLAEKLNVSLGKINFILSGLVEKGIVKAKKLKNNPDKIRWQYILTPEGIKEKIQITKDYLNRRTEEYEYLKTEISELQEELEKKGY